ncbi:MAG: hypothetical protein HPY44_14065 [Armatimonadetes bacterium]|nr:hypothetical protein [Armatimonadota bacterium]
MPRLFAPIIAVICSTAVVAAPAEWVKYIAPNESFSLHHPAGWEVSTEGGAIQITDPVSGRQILIISLPFDADKSPQALAEDFVAVLRAGAPDIKVTAFTEVGDEPGTGVHAGITYSLADAPHRADALVVKSEGQAVWFSISGVAQGYDQESNLNLLSTLIGTMAEGAGSKPPAVSADPRSRAIETNARAFLFVLQFGLGTPLPLVDESRVMSELKRGWARLSDEDLAKYDQYQALVTTIRQAKGEEIDKLQTQIGAAIREVLDQADETDPSISAIKSALKSGDEILVEAETPLTTRTAQGYSELIAFAETLRDKPESTPEQVSAERTQALRAQLLDAWPGYTEDDRKLVSGTPAIWSVYRQVFRYGSEEERRQVREQVAKLAPKPDPAAANGGGQPAGADGKAGPMSMVAHWSLMEVQKMTFNHWQWCMGYKRTMFGW